MDGFAKNGRLLKASQTVRQLADAEEKGIKADAKRRSMESIPELLSLRGTILWLSVLFTAIPERSADCGQGLIVMPQHFV